MKSDVNPKVPMSAISSAVEVLLRMKAWRATKFLSPRFVVRATQPMYGKQLNHGGSQTEIRLTIGRPNYLERAYVKDLIRAKVKFPVQKIWLKYPPKR